MLKFSIHFQFDNKKNGYEQQLIAPINKQESRLYVMPNFKLFWDHKKDQWESSKCYIDELLAIMDNNRDWTKEKC